jgi:hypothetical protein
MANANTWVRWLRWAALVIVIAAILASFWLDGRPGAERLVERIERGFLFSVLAILSVMVLGLMLHFLGNLRRPTVPAGSGEVLLQLQGSRRVSVALVVVLLLFGAIVAYGLELQGQPGDAFDPAPQPLSLEWKAVIAFFTVVWAFLLMAFLARAVRNPPWFVLTRKGFLYQPGDASPGLIRWEDVVDIKEAEVVSAGGDGGPTTRGALVVVLRDSDRYVARYNPILGAVVRLATATLRAQTGGSGDVYLDPVDFGARYEEVKALMLEHATRAH